MLVLLVLVAVQLFNMDLFHLHCVSYVVILAVRKLVVSSISELLKISIYFPPMFNKSNKNSKQQTSMEYCFMGGYSYYQDLKFVILKSLHKPKESTDSFVHHQEHVSK